MSKEKKVRRKAPSGETKADKSEKVKLVRPSGAPPVALVTARHGDGTMEREGRGFSLGELSAAAVSPTLAKKWGVETDLRRRSSSEANVAALKKWFATAKTAAAPKAKEAKAPKKRSRKKQES